MLSLLTLPNDIIHVIHSYLLGDDLHYIFYNQLINDYEIKFFYHFDFVHVPGIECRFCPCTKCHYDNIDFKFFQKQIKHYLQTPPLKLHLDFSEWHYANPDVMASHVEELSSTIYDLHLEYNSEDNLVFRGSFLRDDFHNNLRDDFYNGGGHYILYYFRRLYNSIRKLKRLKITDISEWSDRNNFQLQWKQLYVSYIVK